MRYRVYGQPGGMGASLADHDPKPTEPEPAPLPEPTPEPFVMPVVGDVVCYRSFFQTPLGKEEFHERRFPNSKDDMEFEVLPAIVTGLANDRERALHGINVHIFFNGPRQSEFGRNIAYAPASDNKADTWHWPS